MYKSEIQTSSTESATNASSSQHLETETSYMSHDTSRLVKKKKTSTKALVKRLLGVVADLSSKVDRVLQKKDEPDTNFEPDRSHGLDGEFESTPTHLEPSLDVGEHLTKEMIPIVRPQRKRGVPWYQRTPFTVMQSTPKLKKITKAKKKKVVKSPEKANEDIVNEESNDVSNHLLLDSVEASSTLTFWKEWNSISSNLNTKHRLHMLTLDAEFWLRLLAVTDVGWLISSVLFPINVPHAHWFLAVLHLDIWKVHIYDSARYAIDYWKDFPDGHNDNAVVEFIDIVDATQQEDIANRGDFGVFVSMYMEMIASGVPVKSDKPCRDAGFLYRNRMTNIIWDTK
ncbi:unnamed protein product [Lactuca virosa]|uniref:Ubiquitin-like protease family profile domain-containing protein n=1 Tax=Lactuca virosa TaxID=75947 RepID=A0AAU9MQI3_9ASTR|nr:unnamed protein product [Lactuca virosa]